MLVEGTLTVCKIFMEMFLSQGSEFLKANFNRNFMYSPIETTVKRDIDTFYTKVTKEIIIIQL